MKIVHLVTVGTGGAYRAVERMSEAMNRLDSFDSQVLLRNKVFEDNSGEEFLNSGIKKFISRSKNVINMFFGSGEITRNIFGCDVSKNKLVNDADVIIVHWIESFLTNKSIEKLVKLGKPVVIFLHDMCHITGGCHNNEDCKEYESDCSNCPKTRQGSRVATKNLIEKHAVMSHDNVFVVAPSTDYQARALKSYVTCNKEVTYIPNCFDKDVYFKGEANYGVVNNSIKDNIPIVMFCADNAGMNNKNKGFDILIQALKTFKRREIQLLIIGNISESYLVDVDLDYYCTGFVHDEEKMANLYRLADVNVVPSLQESFCYSACESLASGTPVVAFPVGGLLDQIEHKQNGYFAKYKDSNDLAKGIRYCIENKDRMSSKMVELSSRFSYEEVADRWLAFLRRLL